ncbi:hypothetical protein C7B62_06905 [Pleurocapsa sp. CCALA 161]|uniref:hypothetical protein n=1 Tax=Pleurocapsa sp. CCALA 161 TaxID=2107688 RepID=UPI000D0710EF|nr:hypothetical protein [Pleurocapsa sp. CCALA 161]PSB11151.1 hypothetical protein C7B62_06905 [Pleurocapsa sp. CCALA 161]
MLCKKLLPLSISVILSCGYVQVAQADVACEDKFSDAAFGILEKRHIDRLKQEFLTATRSIKSPKTVYLHDVQAILNFPGEQTKTASNRRIEDRIWIDQDDCQRKVKASFSDRTLVKIKIYGFWGI